MFVSFAIVVNKTEPLDLAAQGRERQLPQLIERLKIYNDLAEASGSEALVQISVSDQAPQQSVIDVLNCLAGLGINKATFTDLSN